MNPLLERFEWINRFSEEGSYLHQNKYSDYTQVQEISRHRSRNMSNQGSGTGAGCCEGICVIKVLVQVKVVAKGFV